MIKKIFICFFAASLLLSAPGYAKNGNQKEKSKISKEEKRAQKEKIRKERQEKIQQKKKNNGVWSKFFGKEQKQKQKAEQTRVNAEKSAMRRYDAEMKKARRLEKKAVYERTRKEKIQLADSRRQMQEYELAEQHKKERFERENLMSGWKKYKKSELAKDYLDGKYSDLYRVPAWPFYMLYAEDNNKDLFQVNIKYDYATDAYDSDGSTKDVTILTFGEKTFQWQDLLLALRLDKNGFLSSPTALNVACTDPDARDPEKVAWNLIKNYLADKNILFLGEVNSINASLNLFRYIKDKDLAIGIEVPFGYKSHRLKFDSNIDPHEAIEQHITFQDASGNAAQNIAQAATSAAAYGTASDVLERTMLPETLNYLLAPKGLSYLPKTSITGIGDISMFLNYYIPTKYLERLLVGGRISWPTAKDASTSKVWAPTLGNGFTKLSAYLSMLFNHQRKYFNPHMFLQASWNWPGHKNTRIPKIINYDGVTPAGGQPVGSATLAHGDLVQYFANRAFTEYDTQIPHFADHVASVRVQPGAEIDFNFGNIWEKLILRRDFLDIFYNFRAKFKDYIGGNLQRDIWAVDLLKDNTYQLEHKLGAQYSYQFDAKTRMNLGCSWIFAGRNVPAEFEAWFAMNVEF